MDFLGHIISRLHAFYVLGWFELLCSILVAIAVISLVLLLELISVPWEISSIRRLIKFSRSVQTDLLAFLFVETNISLFMGMVMFFGITYVLQYIFVLLGFAIGSFVFSSAVLAFATFYLFIDFANYWTHRLCHKIPLLWTIHRYHHSAREMTVFTAARDHPMERALSSMISALPATLIAVPADQFFIFILLIKAIGPLKHSNITSNWGLIGRYLLQSPAAHRIHHSINANHHNTNFASLFQFWDVIFGTSMHPSEEEAKVILIGVLNDEAQMPPLQYIINVFYDFGRALKRFKHD
jgi:sterol desaturase/sphingolipid hydroxylase (fatty acid hydroxylase superfamily)